MSMGKDGCWLERCRLVARKSSSEQLIDASVSDIGTSTAGGTRCVWPRLRKATVYGFSLFSISFFTLAFPFISSKNHFLYFYHLLFNVGVILSLVVP